MKLTLCTLLHNIKCISNHFWQHVVAFRYPHPVPKLPCTGLETLDCMQYIAGSNWRMLWHDILHISSERLFLYIQQKHWIFHIQDLRSGEIFIWINIMPCHTSRDITLFDSDLRCGLILFVRVKNIPKANMYTLYFIPFPFVSITSSRADTNKMNWSSVGVWRCLCTHLSWANSRRNADYNIRHNLSKLYVAISCIICSVTESW